MKKLKIHIIILLFTLGLSTNSCIEPFDVQTLGFENALVVEALITNEFKTHKIKLSNSFDFDEDIPPAESNAIVYITDDFGGKIDFTETFEPGVYNSNIPFAAESGKVYQLFITTSDNKSFESKKVPMTRITQIDNLYVERGTNNLNEDGVYIFVDSYDATGNSRYYRYQYEETYKIIAPFWTFQDLIIESAVPPYELRLENKTTEQKICYKTEFSNGISITETSDLTEDRVEGFEVRFIKDINPIISHRYSILVKQYVQSIDAYTYYKTLKKLSTSQNGLAQNQPGFIESNISPSKDTNEKVIGIFEVSSISEKRIFFNYKDLYPNEALPPFFSLCEQNSPALRDPDGGPSDLITDLQNGYKYYTDNNPLSNNPYVLVPPVCGDCTRLGSNIKPDFWYD